ncbi:MAG: efflux RND transporter permease subunit, partial [Candidatus Omnitrophica bacterium]|nr:efflux RND transporter permease subunit [Candidatus Omnitrophota bacterium]
GAIVSLYVTKTAIGMGALIGMMMLAGIVVNNGIILVEYANELKRTRSNLFRVLMEAARGRLRPVLMTTATTVFGLLPMALDKSEGANLWNPLAITVIGGLSFATPLTLVLVPAIYSIFEQFGKIYSDILISGNVGKAVKHTVRALFKKKKKTS